MSLHVHGPLKLAAMAKRLRSLASVLWDSESCADDYFGSGKPSELQLENERPQTRVLELEGQVLICQAEALSVKDSAMEGYAEPITQQPWVPQLRADVICLPRLRKEILPMFDQSKAASGHIHVDIHKNPKATASQVIAFAEARIHALSVQHPAVFKIGLTSNPIRRWGHATYGYKHDVIERWEGMKVLSIVRCSFSAALIETTLITKFKGTPGCRNERPGGETACPGDGPHFVYVVFRILTPPPRVTALGGA